MSHTGVFSRGIVLAEGGHAAFASIAQQKANALVVGGDPFLNSRRDQIVALAARYAIPAIYEGRAFAEAGGLMNYGTSLADGYRQVGVYTGRVLKGEARRSAGGASGQVRICYQCQDSKNAWAGSALEVAPACGRGNRMKSRS
jgi:hypothetical protein